MAHLRTEREGFLVVVTGAGISLASGIPTFRGSDPDAVWSKDVTELGTYRYFREDPAGSWAWYLKRFEGIEDKRPNVGHQALVELERAWEGEFLLITQNVDTLHDQAGSEALVEVHGRSDRVRCANRGCTLAEPSGSILRSEVDISAFKADPVALNVPTCPECGDVLRQHVLWFDEYYQAHDDFQWDKVVDAAERADLVLLIGTSCSVGVTELVLRNAIVRGKPVVLLDPGASPPYPLVHVSDTAEVALPLLVDRLQGG